MLGRTTRLLWATILACLYPNLAFGQSVVIPECSASGITVNLSVLQDCDDEYGWRRFPNTLAKCKISEVSTDIELSLSKTPKDSPRLSVCYFESSDKRTLVAMRQGGLTQAIASINLKKSAQNLQIDVVSGNLEQSASSATDEKELLISTRQLTDPWISFPTAKNVGVVEGISTSELQLTIREDGLERTVSYLPELDVNEVTVTGFNGDGTTIDGLTVNQNANDNTLTWKLSDSPDLETIRIELVNEFGEQAALNIQLSRPFFTTDNDLISKQINLALVTKIAADESYLKATGPCIEKNVDGLCEIHALANRLYGEAKMAIPCRHGSSSDDALCSDEAQAATRNMLLADIAYRQQLIQWNLPFSGGYAALTPTTPHHERVRMQALADQMQELTEAIEALEDRYYEATVDSQQTDIRRVYELGQDIARQIDAESGELRRVYETIDIDDFETQQASILVEIKAYQARLKELEAQQDSLQSQAANLTRAGLAAASGIPLDQIEAAASGDLQKLAENYITAELTTVGNDLIASSEAAKAIAEQVGKVEAAVKVFKDVERDVGRIELAIRGDRDAIRDLAREYGSDEFNDFLKEAEELETTVNDVVALTRSMDRQRALDFLAETVLTEEQRAEIKQISDDLKPIERVFEAAYVKVMEKGFERALVDEFEIQLGRAVSAAKPDGDEIKRMRQELKNLHRTEIDLLEDPYFARQAVLAISKMDKRDYNIIAAVLTLDPYFLVNVSEIQNILNAVDDGDRTRVESELRRIGSRNGRFVERRNGAICFKKDPENRCISFEKVQKVFTRKYASNLKFTKDQMKDFLDGHIDDLSDDGVMLLYLAKDGAGGVGKNLGTFFENSANRLKRAWDGVDFSHSLFVNNNVQGQRGFTEAEVLVIESLTAAKIRRQLPGEPVPLPNSTASRQLPPAPDPLDFTGGGPDPATNMAMQAALNYAVPGAGIALQLGQTWASMDANRELHEDYQKRLVSAIREQDQLVRSKQLATRRAALAKLEYDRAVAIRDAGRRQLEKFDLAIATSMDRRTFLREKMNLYRPHFYYLAEALRERFEAFDRSLSDWSTGRAEGGLLNQRILDDPRNIRLALDSEIQLFNWLNRSIESTRSSPFVLNRHWQQMMEMVNKYCDDYSCKPGDGRLGQIATSEELFLYGDIKGQAEKQAFWEWRDDRNASGDFSEFISISPGDLTVPKDALNIRLLEVSIVPYNKRGRALSGNRVNLTHPGISQLTVRDRDDPAQKVNIRHQLSMKRALAPNRKEAPNIDELRRRFQSQVDRSSLLSLKEFEGYGLYSNYLLEIINGPGVQKIDNFGLHFTYIYTDPLNIYSEQDFFEKAESSCNGDANPEETWTGAFCNRSAILTYRPLLLNEAGELRCSDASEAITIEIADNESVDAYRKIGALDVPGDQCFKVERGKMMTEKLGQGTLEDPANMAIDTAALRKENLCTEAEITLRSAFGMTSGRCYAGGIAP